MFRFLPGRLCLAILLLAMPLAAQDPPAAGAEKPTAAQRGLAAIEAQLPLIAREKEDLTHLRAELEKAGSEEEQQEIRQQITEKRARIREIEASIRSLASGVPEDAWVEKPAAPRTLTEEAQDALSPVLDLIRNATSGPREMSELRDDIENWENRLNLANQAVERLGSLPPDEQLDPAIVAQLTKVREEWNNRRVEATGELEALRAQLAERESKNRGFVETFSDTVSGFWRSKGINLLLAIGVFIVVFLAGRRALDLLRRHSPLHKREETPVYTRLLDLLAGLLIGLLATAGALLVLYFRGDWLLLSIATIIIVAVIIGSRNSILPYADQIRTILNLGPVREGERIVIDGVPWRVDSLGFYCTFSNPQLGDARLRLPIKEVIGLRSRPLGKKEPWFPSAEDDWVILSDGVFGKVLTQTPEAVVVLQLGGSRRQYLVGDYLSLAPEDLSKGYRISVTFGIDYAHQPICTTEVPDVFLKGVHRALVGAVERENVKSVKVEFMAAGASSLDYVILADFTGEVARSRNVLERLIQKTCVEVCNEQGWIIPFTQITLHQAPAEETPA
ncbi:hypothetical protein [Haloferula sargassicola]|uniref:Mechanosensitive ion channel n=1 Tax=Haloferula sargassicola TaxID=490096 RepID=A0ABP9UNZ2_9BACT